ncbi:MAG: hypothetical protein IJS89_00845, partial [Bacteroidaceae bacterium]|nr:hypothetical protein [Bacteroidaceae bacterium]
MSDYVLLRADCLPGSFLLLIAVTDSFCPVFVSSSTWSLPLTQRPPAALLAGVREAECVASVERTADGACRL